MSTRTTRTLAAAALCCLAAAAATLAQEAPAPRALAIGECTVQPTPDGLKLKVGGGAPLPDGTVLQVGLWFEGAPGTWRRVPVQGGRYEAILGPVKEKVLPGKYQVRVEWQERDQSQRVLKGLPEGQAVTPAEQELYLGEPSEEKAERERVAARFDESLDLLRRVYVALAQQGSYSIDHLKIMKLKNGGKVPEDKAEQMRKTWEQFTGQYWEEFFHTARYDFREFRRYVFVPYTPRAADGIENLLSHFEKWYAAYACEVYEQLDKPIPPKIKSMRQFDIETMKAQIESLVAEICKELGKKPDAWILADLSRPEDGDRDGDWWISKTSKFKIKKPGDGWDYDFSALSPAVRLRIRPVPEERKTAAVVAVEIRDYPEAESHDDLCRLTEIGVQNRWPGYKKLKAKKVQADDETMPGGYRPGYDMLYTTEDAVAGIVQTFQIRDYTLFCRWHKRTYGVLCIAPKGRFEEFREEFDKICDSFKVLDAPDYGKKKQ